MSNVAERLGVAWRILMAMDRQGRSWQNTQNAKFVTLKEKLLEPEEVRKIYNEENAASYSYF